MDNIAIINKNVSSKACSIWHSASFEPLISDQKLEKLAERSIMVFGGYLFSRYFPYKYMYTQKHI